MSLSTYQDDGMMSEINVTPLVDVMLVLLVVFIVTAPLLAPQALKINLPQTPAVASAEPVRHGHLTVSAQGQAELDGQSMTDPVLAETLQQQAREPAFQLQIEADQAVPYGRVAELMALAQKAGISKLAFVTLAGHQ